MNLTKRVLFIISLIVGNTAIGIVVFYYYDRSSMFESIAVFTSLATAIYAIMNEPETKKEEPLLRITPHLAPYGIGDLGLDIVIDNIGDSVANGINGTCGITPMASLPLENSGAFSINLLAPNDEPYVYVAIKSVPSEQLLQSEKVTINTEYYNIDGEKQPSIIMVVWMKDLKRELETRAYRRHG
jgi:hypothetical protein